MWGPVEPLMPADPVQGRRWADHHRSLEAVAWKYRIGSPWRGDELGSFQTAHKRVVLAASVFHEAGRKDREPGRTPS